MKKHKWKVLVGILIIALIVDFAVIGVAVIGKVTKEENTKVYQEIRQEELSLIQYPVSETVREEVFEETTYYVLEDIYQ